MSASIAPMARRDATGEADTVTGAFTIKPGSKYNKFSLPPKLTWHETTRPCNPKPVHMLRTIFTIAAQKKHKGSMHTCIPSSTCLHTNEAIVHSVRMYMEVNCVNKQTSACMNGRCFCMSLLLMIHEQGYHQENRSVQAQVQTCITACSILLRVQNNVCSRV